MKNKKNKAPKLRNKGILQFLLTKSRKCVPHEDKRRKIEYKELSSVLKKLDR